MDKSFMEAASSLEYRPVSDVVMHNNRMTGL